MNNTKKGTRRLACVLACTLAFSLVVLPGGVAFGTETEGATATADPLPALESNIDTSKTATVEEKGEVIYALLSYDGAVDEAYVVNRFRLSSEGSFSDYGNYSELSNLTNVEALTSSGDEVNLAAAEGDFYYQGTLSNPELPWTITLEYTLDGKKVPASEVAALGGQNGQLGIRISTKQNEGVDPRFFEHYTLQISLTLPSDQISNLRAEGATVATAGSDTQVSYVVLPQSEGSYECAVDFEAINMPGISFAAVPYSMSFDLPDTSSLSGELTTLTDSITQLSSGTAQLSSGLAQAATGLETLFGYTDLINTGLAGMGEQSATIASTSASLSSGLADTALALQTLYDNGLIAGDDPATQDQLGALLAGLTSLSDGYTGLDSGLQLYTSGVSELASNFGGINSGLGSSASDLRTLSNNLSTISSGSTELSVGVQDLPEEMQKQIDEFAAAYDFSGFEPASFVSDKNEKVELVQFVFTTPAIELPEETEDEEEISTESSILDKLLALFTGE